MPSESGFLEMAPIDRLREVLGPGNSNQIITLAEAETWFGIQLSQEEREKYTERLGIPRRPLKL